MQYIIALLLIGFVILVHEFGHFIAARIVGVPIKIFSIGFGPKLWAVKKRETEYRIAMIPLGGYVMPDVEDDKEFLALPLYKRIVMTAGGPLASVILPLFCFALVNCFSTGISLNGLFIKPFHQVISHIFQCCRFSSRHLFSTQPVVGHHRRCRPGRSIYRREFYKGPSVYRSHQSQPCRIKFSPPPRSRRRQNIPLSDGRYPSEVLKASLSPCHCGMGTCHGTHALRDGH